MPPSTIGEAFPYGKPLGGAGKGNTVASITRSSRIGPKDLHPRHERASALDNYLLGVGPAARRQGRRCSSAARGSAYAYPGLTLEADVSCPVTSRADRPPGLPGVILIGRDRTSRGA